MPDTELGDGDPILKGKVCQSLHPLEPLEYLGIRPLTPHFESHKTEKSKVYESFN